MESDEGLDVIDVLTAEYLPTHTTLNLGEMIALLKGNLLGDSFEQIDFLYDNTAMAVAELYLSWLDTKKLEYDGEEFHIWANVVDFLADKAALDVLLRYLHDIKNEVPDEDDEREVVELWRESDCWEDWSRHLDTLIARLEQERHTACV